MQNERTSERTILLPRKAGHDGDPTPNYALWLPLGIRAPALAWSPVNTAAMAIAAQSVDYTPPAGQSYDYQTRLALAAQAQTGQLLDFTFLGNPLVIRNAQAGACNFISVSQTAQGPQAQFQTISWGRNGVTGNVYHHYQVARPVTRSPADPNATIADADFHIYVDSKLANVYEDDDDILKTIKYETITQLCRLGIVQNIPTNLFVDVDAPVTGKSMLGAFYASFMIPFSRSLIVAVPLYVDDVGTIQVTTIERPIAEVKTQKCIEYSESPEGRDNKPFCIVAVDQLAYGNVTNNPNPESGATTAMALMSNHTNPAMKPDWLIMLITFIELPLVITYLSAYLYKSLQNLLALQAGSGELGGIQQLNQAGDAATLRQQQVSSLRAAMTNVDPQTLANTNFSELMQLSAIGMSPAEEFRGLLDSKNSGVEALTRMVLPQLYLFNREWYTALFKNGIAKAQQIVATNPNVDPLSQPTPSTIDRIITSRDPMKALGLVKQLISLSGGKEGSSSNKYVNLRLNQGTRRNIFADIDNLRAAPVAPDGPALPTGSYNPAKVPRLTQAVPAALRPLPNVDTTPRFQPTGQGMALSMQQPPQPVPQQPAPTMDVDLRQQQQQPAGQPPLQAIQQLYVPPQQQQQQQPQQSSSNVPTTIGGQDIRFTPIADFENARSIAYIGGYAQQNLYRDQLGNYWLTPDNSLYLTAMVPDTGAGHQILARFGVGPLVQQANF